MARRRGKERNTGLERTWRSRLARHKSSGLTVREFCKRDGGRMRRRSPDSGERGQRVRRGLPLFLPVRVKGAAPETDAAGNPAEHGAAASDDGAGSTSAGACPASPSAGEGRACGSTDDGAAIASTDKRAESASAEHGAGSPAKCGPESPVTCEAATSPAAAIERRLPSGHVIRGEDVEKIARLAGLVVHGAGAATRFDTAGGKAVEKPTRLAELLGCAAHGMTESIPHLRADAPRQAGSAAARIGGAARHAELAACNEGVRVHGAGGLPPVVRRAGTCGGGGDPAESDVGSPVRVPEPCGRLGEGAVVGSERDTASGTNDWSGACSGSRRSRRRVFGGASRRRRGRRTSSTATRGERLRRLWRRRTA